MPAEFFYSDRTALLENLQTAICAQLQHSLVKSPSATLLLSGGATPAPLYMALASAPLPWERISVALVDERWLPPDHPASNERMLRATLLRERAAACQFTGMKNAHQLQGADESVPTKPCPNPGAPHCSAWARMATPLPCFRVWTDCSTLWTRRRPAQHCMPLHPGLPVNTQRA